MSTRLTAPLRVRKATALDRAALNEWIRAFSLLVESEAHSALPAGASRLRPKNGNQVVLLCDAVRVAFAEYLADPTGAADARVFIKPFAWTNLTHQQVRDAVIAHFKTATAQTAPQP